MSSANIEIVRGAYDALATRQLHKIVQLAAPEIEIEQSTDLAWGGRYRGVAGLQQFVVRITQHVDSVMTPAWFIDAGDQVVAVGRTRGVARATGQPFDVAAVHVWTLRGGKIAAFAAFVDHPTMMAALDATLG